MNKLKFMLLGAVAFALAGCTEAEIRDGVLRTCGYVASAKLIAGVVKDIAPLPPGANVGITVAESAIDAICAAVKKQEAGGGRASVLVESRNEATGVVTLRTLSGNVVSRR